MRNMHICQVGLYIAIGVMMQLWAAQANDDDDVPEWQKGDKFEGDIDMTEEEMKKLVRDDNEAFKDENDPMLVNNAIRDLGLRWPQGRVPYRISSSYSGSDKRKIEAAFRHFEAKTCIRFEPKRGSDDNFIDIRPTKGCSSYVGRFRKREGQKVSLSHGCVRSQAVILHELMHAIGFEHEQTRTDRDEHVKIYFENITPGMEYNFKKYGLDRIQYLGAPYDYGSIMHYGRKGFSKNGKVTIQKLRNEGPEIGTASDFSHWDIEKISRLYKCGGNPGPGPTIKGSCFHKEGHTAYESSDSHIRSLWKVSPDECKAACTKESGCVGANYDIQHRGCFLKNAMRMEGRYKSSKYDAFLKGCDGCWNSDPGSTYDTNHIDTQHGLSVAECKAACTAKSGCGGVHYWPRHKQCNLKGTMKGRKRSSSPYYDSYIKGDC